MVSLANLNKHFVMIGRDETSFSSNLQYQMFLRSVRRSSLYFCHTSSRRFNFPSRRFRFQVSASFSSSPRRDVRGKYEYDVFISFRGEDTRDGFTSHLFNALSREKIQTFIDDVELRRGDEISPSLLRSIGRSKISIIVFSDDYAASKWCLEELAEIVACKRRKGQIVLPVFYGIDPSHVRKQTGSFSKAFARHEEHFKGKKTEKLKKWKDALMEAANLSGFDSRVIRPESKLIEEIVRCVLKELNHDMNTNHVSKGLVGIESHVKAVEELLSTKTTDVQVIGIWGMAGMGKTTIAGAAFNSIFDLFEGYCFLANVREESKRRGLICLRDELLCQLLDKKDLNLQGTPEIRPIFARTQLSRKRVLVVLDDVSHMRQLEVLIGDPCHFGPGSRVIVTTRDKDVLRNGVDGMYEVKGLAQLEAHELLCQFALRKDIPSEDHLQLLRKAVEYANGNPLALKVLGSSLYQKSLREWDGLLSRIKKFPEMEVQNVLRVSFDGLNDEEKDIFLDIACFFKGQDRDYVTHILDGCGFSTEIGIRSLIDKSLVTVSENRLGMHDLLQDMGKEIIRQESTRDPGKRSRLWNHEDIYEVLTKNKGTEFVQGIFLNLSEVKEMQLSPQAFANMYNLRVLKIYSTNTSEENRKVHLPRGLEYLSEKLRYLHWHSYPLKTLPVNFFPQNLVELHMNYSRVEQLWEGVKNLPKLKWIDLNHSPNLMKMPDFSEAIIIERISFRDCRNLIILPGLNGKLKSLEFLDLSQCSKLKEFPQISWNVKELLLEETAIEELPLSIQNFNQLARLNMRNCRLLKNVPSITHKLMRLESLDFSGCLNLIKVPEISWNLKELLLNDTGVQELPSSISRLDQLVLLDMKNCKKLKNLPSSICKLKSLQELNLSGSSNFEIFPEVFEPMEGLMHLRLDGTAIKDLPSSIGNLSQLSSLNLENCKYLVLLPSGISKFVSLKYLNISGCSKLRKFPDHGLKDLKSLRELKMSGCQEEVISLLSSGLRSLKTLHLSNCGLSEFPYVLTSISSLTELDVSGNNFKTITQGIKQLSQLEFLDLSHCKSLQHLPRLPNRLVKLGANNCTSMETVSPTRKATSWISESQHIESITFANCCKLDHDARMDLVEHALSRIRSMSKHILKILTFSGSSFQDRCIILSGLFQSMFHNVFTAAEGIYSGMASLDDLDKAIRSLYRSIFDQEPPSIKTPSNFLYPIYFFFRNKRPNRCFLFITLLTAFSLLRLLYLPSTSFCLPGTEIPNWFCYRSHGSSITIQLPHRSGGVQTDLLMGFAVSAVVSFQGYNEEMGLNIQCKCYFQAECNGETDAYESVCSMRGWDGKKGEAMEVTSEHLLMGFDASLMVKAAKGIDRLYKYSNNLFEVSFEFYPVDENGNLLQCCKMTKCGVRPLYMEDLIQIPFLTKRILPAEVRRSK